VLGAFGPAGSRGPDRHDHSLFAVHAHINLLGWVSMALFGLIGTAHPSITEGRAAAAQFWTYNVGVPVMLGALTLRLKGFPSVEPLIAVASILIGCSVLLFVWLVFSRIGITAERLSSATRESRLS
jgi:drug/metabolite transporter superfamily protein YnfA